jgi:hypothetical protein
VFANASLFHVPRSLLPNVLTTLFSCLVPGGVPFCSNPRAFDADTEGWSGERHGCYLTSAAVLPTRRQKHEAEPATAVRRRRTTPPRRAPL